MAEKQEKKVEDFTKAELVELVKERDRNIAALRKSLTEAQLRSSALESAVAECQASELRGRRLADAAYEVLIQFAGENAQTLAKFRQAVEEAEKKQGLSVVPDPEPDLEPTR